MTTPTLAVWETYAEKYEKGTGGATRYVARRLMEFSPPFSGDSVILDNACGTGFVIDEIQQHISSTVPKDEGDFKAKVYAADIAAPMIDVLNSKVKHAQETGRWPNIGSITTHAVAAENLDDTVVPSGVITHSYTNFGLFFSSDTVRAAGHIYRTLAPGGVAFITSWKDFGSFNAVSRAERTCNPDCEEVKMPFDPRWEDATYVTDVLHKGGFEKDKIQVTVEESFMRAESADVLATRLADLFAVVIRGTGGWKNPEAKQKWVSTLSGYLQEDDHFIQEGENAIAFRMSANVAVCVK